MQRMGGIVSEEGPPSNIIMKNNIVYCEYHIDIAVGVYYRVVWCEYLVN